MSKSTVSHLFFSIRKCIGNHNNHLNLSHGQPLYHAVKLISQSNRSFSSRIDINNPYEILGIPKTADLKQIKIAYFREAKKHHPDLNPGDAKAKDRFQKVAYAYEILSDPVRKAKFDSTGRTEEKSSYYDAKYRYNYQHQKPQQDPEEMFRNVWNDLEVVLDAWKSLMEDTIKDLSTALTAVDKGDWKPAMDVIQRNKGIIFGVVIPTVLFLRFPVLVIPALRMIYGIVPIALTVLIRTGQMELVARWLWRAIVEAARKIIEI
eukprot:gene768-1465_t